MEIEEALSFKDAVISDESSSEDKFKICKTSSAFTSSCNSCGWDFVEI